MKHHERLDRYEEWFTTDLLQDEAGHCVGAICRNLQDGHLEVFNAKSVILASGGAGQAYKPTTNGLIVTGDGMAQALRIGAKLKDMEIRLPPREVVRRSALPSLFERVVQRRLVEPVNADQLVARTLAADDRDP
jgi:succinate dehydrogenase/fumarate reductase flavoprotein subunit